MTPCAARPRWTPRCGVLSRTHIYVRYGCSLRPCLAAPIAPDRRSLILNRVLSGRRRHLAGFAALQLGLRVRDVRGDFALARINAALPLGQLLLTLVARVLAKVGVHLHRRLPGRDP